MISRRNFLGLTAVTLTVLILAVPIGCVAQTAQTRRKLPTPQKSKYLEEIAGVQIHYKTDLDIFIKSWNRHPASIKAENISEEEIKRTSKILRGTLGKYPHGFLEEYLKHIHTLHSLHFNGSRIGGSYSKKLKIAYITNNGRNSAEFIEGLVHHELSSILWKNFRKYFDERSWRQINPPDFEYFDDKGGTIAIKTGRNSLKGSLELYRKGFLCEYGQSNLENDLNIFSQAMLDNDGTFWKYIEMFDKLKAKVDIVVDFYHSIDPRFTLGYFKKVSTQ